MVRDISQLKKQIETRESPEPKLVAKQEKSISSVRIGQIRNDTETVMVFDKQRISTSLSKAIKIKREQLLLLGKTAKSIVAGANAEADRIVEDTRKRASDIISRAKSERASAETLNERAKKREKELDELSTKLKQQEEDVNKKASFVAIEQEDVNKQKLVVNELSTAAGKRHDQAVEIFINALSIFDQACGLFESLENLNSQATNSISQTLLETGTIMKETALALQKTESNKADIKEQAKELQNKEKWIIDRSAQLERAAREIGHRHAK